MLHKEISSEELLRLICKGDDAAFTELYRRYWKRLYIYAYKIFQDETACEDIVQDIFLKLWLSESKGEIQNVESYLFKAVRYKVANCIRDFKWNESHDTLLFEIIDDVQQDSSLEFKELKSSINSTIQTLPMKCREIFILFYDNELSIKEIAAQCDISIRTVEKHIYNARQVLRKKHLDNNRKLPH
jgi:RNA polymerase sigma-70 factor (family 1)